MSFLLVDLKAYSNERERGRVSLVIEKFSN